jgi:hypothetical protein
LGDEVATTGFCDDKTSASRSKDGKLVGRTLLRCLLLQRSKMASLLVDEFQIALKAHISKQLLTLAHPFIQVNDPVCRLQEITVARANSDDEPCIAKD